MKTKLTTLTSIAILALALAVPLQATAQTYGTALTWTNGLTATQTVTVAEQVIDTSTLTELMLLCTGSTVAGTNGPLGFEIVGSHASTGDIWTTEPSDTMACVLTLDGTNIVRAWKVIDCTYWRRIKVRHVTNGVEAVTTNITATPWSKQRR